MTLVNLRGQLLLSVHGVGVEANCGVGRNELAIGCEDEGIQKNFEAISLDEALVKVFYHEGGTTKLFQVQILCDLGQADEVNSFGVVNLHRHDSLRIELLKLGEGEPSDV